MTGSHISQIASAVGKVGRYSFDSPALLNQRVGKIYSKDESKLDNNFLYYLISRPEVQFELATNAGGSANQANISPQQIKNLEFEIPDIKVQKKIASILSSLDDKIELNRRMNQTLEQIAATLFKKYFVDDIDPHNLPGGWRKGVYNDLVEVWTGKGLKRDELFEHGKYDVFGANGVIGRTDKFLCDKKLLLTGRVGTLGTIQDIQGKCWVSDNVLVSEPKSDKNFYYAKFLLSSFDFKSLNRGSTQPLISQTDLKNHSIVIPSSTSLIRFHQLVSSLYQKVYLNGREIKTLSSVRNALLPKLMSGEIDLSTLHQNETIHAEVFS